MRWLLPFSLNGLSLHRFQPESDWSGPLRPLDLAPPVRGELRDSSRLLESEIASPPFYFGCKLSDPQVISARRSIKPTMSSYNLLLASIRGVSGYTRVSSSNTNHEIGFRIQSYPPKFELRIQIDAELGNLSLWRLLSFQQDYNKTWVYQRGLPSAFQW